MGNRKLPRSLFLPPAHDAASRALNQSILDAYRVVQRRVDDSISSDTLARRPIYEGTDRFFWASDTSALYFDTPAGWVLVGGSGSGPGSGKSVV